MTNSQRGAVIGVGAAYAVAIVLLVVTRNVLYLSEDDQFTISIIAAIVLLWATSRLGPLRWRSERRTGNRLVASFLVLFAATIVSLAAHAFMPTDVLPVVAVGVIFPFLLVGQLAIDWRQLGINAPSV
jgi:hypothetical protein